MSTKTTFKRIALVTVAALGFGVMSVAPSNAAVQNLTSTLSSASASVNMGVAATVTQTVSGLFNLATDTATTTVALTSWPAAATNASLAAMITVNPTAVDTVTANTATTSNGQVAQAAAGTIGPNSATFPYLGSGRTSWSVTPSASTTLAGTYVYTFTTAVTGNTSVTSTWTVTVVAPTLVASEAFIAMGQSAPTADGTTLSTTIVSGVATTLAVATINVRQWSDAAKLVALPVGYTSAVEVSVTGAGAVGVTSDSSPIRGPSAATAALGTAAQTYWLYSDGRTGPATITIKVGGTQIAQKTYNFVGSLPSMTVASSKVNNAPTETLTLTASGLDANSIATAAPVVTAGLVIVAERVATVRVPEAAIITASASLAAPIVAVSVNVPGVAGA
jgi:hypothetical protein